ncbi:MAG: 7-carboxy-7-deazaguanine synthase QueE [Bacteroidota bacterium]
MIRTRKHIPTNLKRRQANPLPVMEQFYTLQGEGRWTGTAAYFIRLAGCDVGCHWCDVKESWHPKEDQYEEVHALTEKALASGTERVVITGGEPTVYDLSLLTSSLRKAGLKVHMETAGPHAFSGEFDWVCLSPKKFLPPQEAFYQKAHELKVIIFNDSDFQWAEEHAARCAEHVELYLQPEWSRRDRFHEKIVAYIKANPQWRLSLQTHKYLDIP